MSYGQVAPQQSGSSTCYRHPDRTAYVSCNRCGRIVCPECQVAAPVGIQCVECVKQSNRSMPMAKTEFGATVRASNPVVTYTLIALNVLVFILQFVLPGLTRDILMYGAFAYDQPWRIVTSAFAHSTASWAHILMNMYGVFICGTLLEPRLGRLRFVVLYFLSALGGSLGIMALSGAFVPTLGASGALSGLFLALFVVFRTNRMALRQMGIILVLNIVMGFVVPSISWQGHLGGCNRRCCRRLRDCIRAAQPSSKCASIRPVSGDRGVRNDRDLHVRCCAASSPRLLDTEQSTALIHTVNNLQSCNSSTPNGAHPRIRGGRHRKWGNLHRIVHSCG